MCGALWPAGEQLLEFYRPRFGMPDKSSRILPRRVRQTLYKCILVGPANLKEQLVTDCNSVLPVVLKISPLPFPPSPAPGLPASTLSFSHLPPLAGLEPEFESAEASRPYLSSGVEHSLQSEARHSSDFESIVAQVPLRNSEGIRREFKGIPIGCQGIRLFRAMRGPTRRGKVGPVKSAQVTLL